MTSFRPLCCTLRELASFLSWGLLVGLAGYPSAAVAQEPDGPPVVARVEDPRLALARQITTRALALFDARHYDAAFAEFTRAYAALSGHPRQYVVLHNLAVCQARLQRYDRALELYEQYLERAPATESDRSAVLAEVTTLRSLVGTIVVHSTVRAEVWVDGRYLGFAPGRFTVPAGQHWVELRAALYETERREVRLGPTQTRSLSFSPQRLSTYTGPSRVYFWSAVGVSGASAIAGTTLGLLALSERREGRDRAALHLDSQAHADRTDDYALAADACFGGALLFGATATILYFVTDWSPPERHVGSR